MNSSIAPAPGPFGPLRLPALPAAAPSIAPASAQNQRARRHRLARRITACALALLALTMVASSPALAQSTPEPIEIRPTGRDRNAVKLQTAAIESIQTLLKGNRTSEALQVAEKALRQFPGNVQMRFLYGVALTDSGETDQAINTFTELTQSHPELAEPYNNLAVLHATAGDLEAARDALEQAIVAVPDYALAAENLGDLYVRLAVQAYQKGVEKKTADTTIRRKLVQARSLLDTIEAGTTRPTR